MLKRSLTCIVAVALLVMSPAVFAENQKVKAVFDFRIDDPKSADFVLKGIRQIYSAKPNQDFVVIFMGYSPKLFSVDPKDREKYAPEDQALLDEIATTVSAMVQDGIKLEVCSVAVKDFSGMDTASVLPEITVIADGWTSLIEYELDGYAPVAAF